MRKRREEVERRREDEERQKEEQFRLDQEEKRLLEEQRLERLKRRREELDRKRYVLCVLSLHITYLQLLKRGRRTREGGEVQKETAKAEALGRREEREIP